MNRPKYRSETRLLESINRNDRAIKFGPTPQLALEPTTETRSKFSKLVTYIYIYILRQCGLKRDTLIKEKEDAMDVPSFEERFRIVDVWREFGGRFKYFSNFFLRTFIFDRYFV